MKSNTRRQGKRRRGDAKAQARRGGRDTNRARRSARPAPIDGTLVTSTAILIAIGIVMNYSATAALAIGETLPPLAARHAAGVGFALVCAFVAYRLPLSFWRRVALPFWVITVAILLLTLVVGVDANGARRWLGIPGLPMALQPSEFARIATVLAVSALLAGTMERREAEAGALRKIAALVGCPTALLILQPDFSGAVLLVTIVGLVLFAAGIRFRTLALPAAAAVSAALLYVAARPYALARVRGFFDPWQSARGEGFQLVQSFVAFGRGGSFGVGLGDGRQKLFYLPEAHTDFILSVAAEELGLLGVMLILGSFTAFAIAGFRVARRAKEPFALLVAFGMTSLVAVPAIINAAVVMGALPTTGLALPFLSHGSNSLCCTAVAVGILLRTASREAAPRRAHVRNATPRGLVRA